MKNQNTQYEVPETPLYRRLFIRMMDSFRNSHFLRGVSTLTLFPQHPEMDFSVRTQRRELAENWREVYGCLWDAYHQESARIREYERKK